MKRATYTKRWFREKIAERKIVNNYGSFEKVFVRGRGATLFDKNKNAYIDFIAGIGVNSLGHTFPPLMCALQSQVQKEIHISNYYFSDVGLQFADELLNATHFDGAYFGNSGAEANEAAIKLARKYGYQNGNRKTIYTLENSFHGRTIATLSATGQTQFHPDYFAPYVSEFKFIRANDWDELKKLNRNTSALIMECVQGEGGVNLLDKKWAQAASEVAHEAGALVIADEVQTGMGRCGALLASDILKINADVVTLAKGIAAGIPMGACLFRNNASGIFVAGDHQSTFAGNPLACRAGLVVLETLQSENFFDEINRKGKLIRSEIASWNLPIVKEVRGLGLMIGVQIADNLKPFDVEAACLDAGLCVSTAGTNVIRFLPPLVISDDEIQKGLAIFKNVLGHV